MRLTIKHTTNRKYLYEIWDRPSAIGSLIVLGEHHLKQPNVKRQISSINKIIIHPQFNPVTMHNDMALVQLSEPAEWNDLVQPVCLPDADENQFTGVQATVVGWGTTETGIAIGALAIADTEMLHSQYFVFRFVSFRFVWLVRGRPRLQRPFKSGRADHR